MPPCTVCAAATSNATAVCAPCATSCRTCGRERCLLCVRSVERGLDELIDRMDVLRRDPRILARFPVLASVERHHRLPWMQRARICRAAHWLTAYHLRCSERDLVGERAADDRTEAILQSFVRHLQPRPGLLRLEAWLLGTAGLPDDLLRAVLAFTYTTW